MQQPRGPVQTFKTMLQSPFSPRTMRWNRLHLQHVGYFTQMQNRLVTSWVRLICRAAAENSNILQLLPRFASLIQPPAYVIEMLEYLVATMQSLLGPLPVTETALKREPHKCLSWLHLVLTDFQAAQGTTHAPKLFSMLPQTGHQQSFIKISTTALHK